MMTLVGCNDKEAGTEKKPKEVHNDFLMYEEEYVNDEGTSIGNLYIMSEGKEKEKIASDVVDTSYVYINSKNKVLFINEENELYEYEPGKEKEKLAKDVIGFEGDYPEDIVTYQKEDNDLYIIRGEEEDEKIASSILQYEVVGDYIYFLEEDGDLSMFNSKDKQESEIASDVSSFIDLNHEDEIAYLDDDSALYYKKVGEEESIKITSDEVLPDFIKKIGDNLVYLNIDDGDSAELYESPITEGGQAQKIASDIRYYEYYQGNFYYINNDNNLYMKSEQDENSTKLASDVLEIKINKGTIVYLNTDNELFTKKNEEKSKKIASSVSDFSVTPNGEIVYSTEDMDLFVNNKKIASDVQGFKHYYGNVAFATKDDKLYLMKDMGEKKLVEGDMNQFSNASFHNKTIYNNYLSFEDISGVWKSSDSEGSYYLKIDADGTLTYVVYGYTEKLELDYSGYGTLNATSESESTEISFALGQDKTLQITMDDTTNSFTKSTEAEANEYAKKIQLEEDKEEISGLMDNYISKFTYAVNYGDEEYITDYMDPNSSFYNEQVSFIQSSYEKDITEDLEDFKVESINQTAEGVYVVNTVEDYNIYQGYEDYTGSKKTFKNSYTVKKVGEEFLISGIKVSQTDTGTL